MFVLFAAHLPGEKFCPSSYTFLARQSHPSQKYFEQRKEMTFDGRRANIRAPVVCGLYALPLLSKFDEKGFA